MAASLPRRSPSSLQRSRAARKIFDAARLPIASPKIEPRAVVLLIAFRREFRASSEPLAGPFRPAALAPRKIFVGLKAVPASLPDTFFGAVVLFTLGSEF